MTLLVMTFLFSPWAVVANSDESQLLTPGKMSQRQGKEAYPTPTKEPHQPSLSPASLHSQGKRPQAGVLVGLRKADTVVPQRIATQIYADLFLLLLLLILFVSFAVDLECTFLSSYLTAPRLTSVFCCFILVNQVFFHFLVLWPPYIQRKILKISKRFCLCELHLLMFTVI